MFLHISMTKIVTQIILSEFFLNVALRVGVQNVLFTYLKENTDFRMVFRVMLTAMQILIK